MEDIEIEEKDKCVDRFVEANMKVEELKIDEFVSEAKNNHIDVDEAKHNHT